MHLKESHVSIGRFTYAQRVDDAISPGDEYLVAPTDVCFAIHVGHLAVLACLDHREGPSWGSESLMEEAEENGRVARVRLGRGMPLIPVGDVSQVREIGDKFLATVRERRA